MLVYHPSFHPSSLPPYHPPNEGRDDSCFTTFLFPAGLTTFNWLPVPSKAGPLQLSRCQYTRLHLLLFRPYSFPELHEKLGMNMGYSAQASFYHAAWHMLGCIVTSSGALIAALPLVCFSEDIRQGHQYQRHGGPLHLLNE